MHYRSFLGSVLAACFGVVVASPSSAQKILPDGVTDLSNQIATHFAKEQKRKIAVVPFRELGGQPTVFGTFLAEELVTQLVNTGSLDLVERATLDKIFGELKLNESGAIDPNTAKQVGKLAGADAIVTGTITDLQSYVGVNCRLIDTQTGRIFAAAQTRIVKDDDVKKIMGMPLDSASGGGNHYPAVAALQGQTPSKQPAFVTDAYRLTAESLRKVGGNASLLIVLESATDKLIRFGINNGSCYLLDENGERWDTRETDSAAFTWSGVDLVPGTRIRSKFSLAAKDSNSGKLFTLICTENSPQGGRKITVSGIATQ